MSLPPLRPPAALLVVALLLAGCDAASDTDGTVDFAEAESAAASVANAVAVAPGGALNDLAEATAVLGSFDGARGAVDNPGCDFDRTYDEEAQAWLRSVECERSSPSGAFSAFFARTHAIQFLGDDGPQQSPVGATAATVDLLSGAGRRTSPRFSHELTDIDAFFEVTDLDQDLVTVNGTHTRSAIDVFDGRRARRTFAYTLDLALIDVVGPRRHRGGQDGDGVGQDRPPLGPIHRRWARAVSGTIEGQIVGTITVETPDGVRTRDVNRSFTVTFGEEDGLATVAFGRAEAYRVDLETGAVVE